MARIHQDLVDPFNAQIGRELGSSHQYIGMAAFFDDFGLALLAKRYFTQAEEEREHAMKFVHYLAQVDAPVRIPAVPAPRHDFRTVEDALRLAYEYEVAITADINSLMDTALRVNDYAAQEFLRWFITEQVEEVHTAETMLRVATAAGERNVMMIEAYLVHMTK
jgi:ferritin